MNDDTRTNNNELHQQLCGKFKIDYSQEMDIITKVKVRLEHKINITLPALLPNKITSYSRGPVTSNDETRQDKLCSRNKRAIPLLAIAQGTTAIGSMLINGINALVDAKRASSFNNAIKMMSSAHNRYNLLFRQTHKMQIIHHFALLLFKNYLTIQVGTLQRIHRQYVRYESALDSY